MNEHDLFRAMDGIFDEHLLESEKRSRPLRRMIAACIALFVLICVPAVTVMLHKGGLGDKGAAAIAALEYNGAFYEACDHPDVLVRFGLPRKITPDMAGEHLAYLQSDGGAGYEETVHPTDIELYTYAPVPCRGVYILRDGETYMAALFCNPYQFDSNTHMEFAELFRVYGVESAQDIVSVAEVEWSGDRVIGQAVEDPEMIESFYRIATSLTGYGNDDFQALTFEDTPEDAQVDLHRAYADDFRRLRVETKDGLRFYIGVHPSFGWMDMALSHYKMDAQMSAWFCQNFS